MAARKYKKVEQVPSNKLVEMTPELYQEFCIGGCVPMCHLTFKNIKIGEKFQLASLKTAVRIGSGDYNRIETKEVMLSEGADPDEYENRSEKKVKQEKERREKGGGCFRVNGKIVL